MEIIAGWNKTSTIQGNEFHRPVYKGEVRIQKCFSRYSSSVTYIKFIDKNETTYKMNVRKFVKAMKYGTIEPRRINGETWFKGCMRLENAKEGLTFISEGEVRAMKMNGELLDEDLDKYIHDLNSSPLNRINWLVPNSQRANN